MENTGGQPPASGPWPEAREPGEDPAVNSALAPLAALARTPVPDHHAVYAALHDGLLAELNAEPSEER